MTNDGNVLNCARGERVGVVTGIRDDLDNVAEKDTDTEDFNNSSKEAPNY